MIIDKFVSKFYQDLFPKTLSLYLIISVFNAPTILRYALFIFLIYQLLINIEIYDKLKNKFLRYHHYLTFSSVCVVSFLFINKDLNYLSSPQIINIIALSLFAVLLVINDNIYEKTMELIVLILTPILIISLFFHFFIFNSTFLSATLFFTEFEKEDFSTKNTLGVFLCLIMPYLVHKLERQISLINIFTITLFSLSIFYTFSRTALLLYFLVLILMFFTLRKKIMIIASSITFLLIVSSLLFQITPERYNYLKGISNQQLLSDQSYDPHSAANVFTTQSHRSQYIFNSLAGFLDKPVFGHGLTTFQQNHAEFDSENRLIRKPVTHNDYTQVLYEMGLVGALTFIYLLFYVFKNIIVSVKINKFSIIYLIQILILMISINFINLLDHPLFWILISLNINSDLNEKKKLNN